MTPKLESPTGLFAVLRGVIGRAIATGGFPNGPRGKNLFLAADFSGTHRGPLYTTYAFLLLDLDRNGWWINAQRVFRMEALQDNRRLSFKALNDGVRRRALLPFLLMADEIEGALIVVAVDKKCDSLFQPASDDADLSLVEVWKPAVHEHLMRVMHLSALCVSLISRTDQNLMWICDQDDVASNDRQIIALTKLFGHIWAHMTQHNMGHLRLGSTRSDDGSLALEDLAAVPDLAAGAACEVLSHMRRQGVFPVRGIYSRLPLGLTGKTQRLLRWLSVSDRPLKRFMVVIDEGAAGKSTVTLLKLALTPDLLLRS
jgi:hypothetical protein